MADPLSREELGHVVRLAWVQWAERQPDPKPSWLVPWEALDEVSKEADRVIGEAVLRYVRAIDQMDRIYARVKGGHG